MKKWIAWIMVWIMVVGMLTGCGSTPEAPPTAAEETGSPAAEEAGSTAQQIAQESSGQADASVISPINGTWEYTGDMDCAYIFNTNGTGAYRYYGADMLFTYTDDGTSVSILFSGNYAPNVMAYSINGKILNIEDSFGNIVSYEKIKDSDTPLDIQPPSQQAEASASYDWWEADWYGWWCIRNGTGSYEPATNVAWDAYARIELSGDNSGFLKIWDTGISRDEGLIHAYVDFVPGSSSVGAMVANRVVFFPNGYWNNGMEAATVEDRNDGWTVDPADSTVSHFENMLEITGHYQDPENAADSFDYFIYLRPWGTLWEDVRSGDTSGCIYSDMMPLYYDNWYLSLLSLGYLAPPASFDEGITIIEDAINRPAGSLDPADKEGADGIVSLQTLKDALDWCKHGVSYSTTYDEVAARFGAHGKLVSEDGNHRFYRWQSDQDNYIKITFTVKDGQEYWNVTQWNGLK